MIIITPAVPIIQIHRIAATVWFPDDSGLGGIDVGVGNGRLENDGFSCVERISKKNAVNESIMQPRLMKIQNMQSAKK